MGAHACDVYDVPDRAQDDPGEDAQRPAPPFLEQLRRLRAPHERQLVWRGERALRQWRGRGADEGP
eukprot:3843832-Rhodomonas_salina.1